MAHAKKDGPMSAADQDGTVHLSGRIEITKDRRGLEAARALWPTVDHAFQKTAGPAMPLWTGFVPFSGDAASFAIGGMTAENAPERVAVYGSTVLDANSSRAMKALLEACIQALSRIPDLPEAFESAGTIDTVANPFA